MICKHILKIHTAKWSNSSIQPTDKVLLNAIINGASPSDAIIPFPGH